MSGLVNPMTGLPVLVSRAPGYRLTEPDRVNRFGWGRRKADGSPKIHKGVDWHCVHGQPVYFPLEGTVIRAYASDSYGLCIWTKHEAGVRTRASAPVLTVIAHLSGLLVTEGQRVLAGQIGGFGGSTGNADMDDPHVHFEVHRGVEWKTRRPFNPEWWLWAEGEEFGIPDPREMGNVT